MEIISACSRESLELLRQNFEHTFTKHGRGISQIEFVSQFLSILHPPDDAEATKDLVELYNRIDISGSGFVEWQAFTSHCVEAGLRLTTETNPPLEFNYVEDTDYSDTTSHAMVNFMRIFPCIQVTKM